MSHVHFMNVVSGLGGDSDEQRLTDTTGRPFGLPVPRLSELLARTPRLDLIAFAECARRRCMLLDADSADGDALEFLTTDGDAVDLVALARTRFGALTVSLVSNDTFDAMLAHCETDLSALGSVALAQDGRDADGSAAGVEVLDLRQIGNEESPAIRFVNSTLYDALKTGASDIHLEMDPTGLNLKFRLDGVLTAMRRIDRTELAAQAISRIKVMSQLDIAERRVPQDGRLQISLAGRVIDVRVSIMPSIHGEDAVLRILDRRHLAETLSGLTLAKLGFDEDSAEALRALCRRPHGMLLVTGPTGSGKTTTLYAAIAETHLARDKIITIEDPVEYHLPGVLQIPVNERKGLTFARGLRSILRHDPDKILVGEIRDAETAQIAVQSALTGHLVFTTVHANSVFDVVGRFDQFGIDAYTLASAVNGILAQRLMRRLCPHCAVPVQPVEPVPGLEDALRQHGAPPHWLGPRGCEHCRGTGYKGRAALGELLLLTPELKALIASRAPVLEIQAAAKHIGWRPLRTLALLEAMRGHTSLDEVDRVAV